LWQDLLPVPLIATDALNFNRQVVRRIFGLVCLYGQVIKKRRKTAWSECNANPELVLPGVGSRPWNNSEDSRQRNPSYIERVNLTIRQGSAYLCRRSFCHARRKQRLENYLELLRCHYNFHRPHRALKFGLQVRTLAMPAGLAKKRPTFHDVPKANRKASGFSR
jgi:hypothetical protein